MRVQEAQRRKRARRAMRWYQRIGAGPVDNIKYRPARRKALNARKPKS